MESLTDPTAVPLGIWRQERFAQLRSLGLPTLEAAREAGYANMSPENARKLANKPQSNTWIGRPIAEALRLDLDQPHAKHRVKAVLATWIKTGAFVVFNGKDEQRHERQFVGVGTWA
jgi:hypothetical protein